MSDLTNITERTEASRMPALTAQTALTELTELANRHNLPALTELLKSTELLKPTQPTKISEKQLAANRANAAKSTGPTSEEGKNNSRMNASKHGLTGIAVLMRPEEREARDIFIAAFLRRLAPDGPIETEYSEAIAEQTWRLKRARSLDQNIFALSDPALYNKPGVHDHPEIDRAVAHAKGFVENSAEFQRLTTYERRLELSVERNTAALEKLQAQRKAASRRSPPPRHRTCASQSR